MLKLEKRGKYTTLAVEDNPANLQYLLHLLRKLKASYITAATGEEAIEIVHNNNFEYMLFDIHLGSGMSGLDLMKELRKEERFKDTPIFAITAVWKDRLRRLEQEGFTESLAKPYSFNDLKLMFKKHGIQIYNYDVERNILKETDQCDFNFTCLDTGECGDNSLCRVFKIIGSKIAIIHRPSCGSEHCSYYQILGYNHYCRCPVRIQLYRTYDV